MTASTPRTSPSAGTTTGIPPPPAAMTMKPRLISVAATPTPRIASGRGEAGIFDHLPAVLLLQLGGAGRREERADRLGRLEKRGIGGVDLDLRDERDDL